MWSDWKNEFKISERKKEIEGSKKVNNIFIFEEILEAGSIIQIRVV